MKSKICAITYLMVLAISGCENPQKRVKNFSPVALEPAREYSVTLKDFARRKVHGKDNRVFALQFIGLKSTPPELPGLVGRLTSAFAVVASTGIVFAQPGLFDNGAIRGIDSFDEIWLSTRIPPCPPEIDSRTYLQNHPFNKLIVKNRNGDGSEPVITNLRVDVCYAQDFVTMSEGAIADVLARHNGERHQLDGDVKWETKISELTVEITTSDYDGQILKEQSEATARVVKEKAGNRFGLFLFSSGGEIYQSVTVEHSLKDAFDIVMQAAVARLLDQYYPRPKSSFATPLPESPRRPEMREQLSSRTDQPSVEQRDRYIMLRKFERFRLPDGSQCQIIDDSKEGGALVIIAAPSGVRQHLLFPNVPVRTLGGFLELITDDLDDDSVTLRWQSAT